MSQGDNDHENNTSNQSETSGEKLEDSSQNKAVQSVTENPSEQTPSSEKETGSSQEPKTGVGNKKSGKGGIVLFVFILILIAFGGGGYGAYYYLNEQMLERESALKAGLQRVDESFSRLEQSDQDLNRRQGDLQRAITAVVSDTENQMKALAERLAASESAGPDDWTLAEVEYLMRIANQRLITSRDNDTAIEMLKEADSILKELAYPELASVRRQLAADITGLSLAKQVDIEGIYFALESVSVEVAKLDQFAPEKLGQVEPDLDEEPSKLMVLWNEVVRTLSKYVRIDTDAGEPVYLVTDEEEVVLRLTIQLQIRQAQLALLSGRQDIYSVSLKSAAESVKSNYESDLLASSLEEFSSRDIAPETTNLNATIRLLSDVVDMLSKTHSFDETGG